MVDTKEVLVAYIINDECISCGACEPLNARCRLFGSGDGKYEINPDLCTLMRA